MQCQSTSAHWITNCAKQAFALGLQAHLGPKNLRFTPYHMSLHNMINGKFVKIFEDKLQEGFCVKT